MCFSFIIIYIVMVELIFFRGRRHCMKIIVLSYYRGKTKISYCVEKFYNGFTFRC